MVRPCAKYARLNCEHRQTNRRKTSAGFLSACSPARCAVYFWAWFYVITSISTPSRRASVTLPRATFHACAMRKHFTRRSNGRRISRLRDSADISPPGAACPACSPARCAVYFWGVVLCRNKYKRAKIARFRNVAEGNISRLLYLHVPLCYNHGVCT